MSKERLAEHVSRTAASVRNWEAGVSVPPRGVRTSLAGLLGAPDLIEAGR
jgi:DNA-binding transcriptional regulator YiaG